ncbi:hypothetical protein CSIM01_08803 [Colletotrichum simmondsii]|uniref:MAS3 protein n=1 Tax=Colletotrichum simmondsii TaxID=703756 RepID=A0A135T8N2_9PEZI|nr:hypothetical protein CSIM01_08803 [Colletotrichum simmondsii]
MKYGSALLLAAFAATNVFAHGVIDGVQGANGVNLPGLSLIDDTPRDCASPRCGSEADTSIIRDRELGTAKASALGRTQGGGPVDAAAMMATFMNGAAGNTTATKAAREIHEANLARRYANIAARQAGKGTKTPKGTVETGVNQDGAGPLKADIDGTSGGTDPAAFKTAEVTQNVPGIGIGGLSGASTMDFPVKVQMPAGMTCDANVGGASNVCVARLRNAALAGPFGGSVAFTQSTAARKRAVEFNLKKRSERRSARDFKA